jgi:predicted aspartyl protease
VITRRSILTNLGLVALLGGGAWLVRERLIWPAPKPRFEGPIGAWLPFSAPELPLVTILAGLGGTTVNALIDSGAQYTSVDRALVDQLKLAHGPSIPMVALGVGGAAQIASGVSLEIELGGLVLPQVRAASLDLQMVSSALGINVPLIVGFDVLSTLLADFDFPHRRVRFCDPRTAILPSGGVAAPVRRVGKALIAQIRIDGTPMEVLVDTGATGMLGLSAAGAAAAGLDAQAGRAGESVVLGGVAPSRVVSARVVEFAGQTFRDVEVHILQLPRAPGFPRGLMGVDAFADHRVLFDAGGGRLQLYLS